MKKIIRFLFNKKTRFNYLAEMGFYNKMSDKFFLKKKWKLFMGYEPDLNNHITYNEKLQWLKIHDRKDIYTTLVDKYEVKKYISDKTREQYIIPTLGVYDRFELGER